MKEPTGDPRSVRKHVDGHHHATVPHAAIARGRRLNDEFNAASAERAAQRAIELAAETAARADRKG